MANNPNEIYYIDGQNNIKSTDINSDLAYILRNSDWNELKVKEQKKNRYFLIRVMEGVPECDQRCEKCQSVHKCSLAGALKETVGGRKMNGQDLKIKELGRFDIPYYLTPSIA